MTDKAQIAEALYEIGCVQFGRFTLKSGIVSPIYIDLRLLASYPAVLQLVAGAVADLIECECGEYERLAAIPMGALPIGIAVALRLDRPLIYPRMDVKDYGTRRVVEGAWDAGDRALVIDDLITRGDSKLEAVARLENSNLRVTDLVVLIDRESGGRETLAAQGYALHAVLTLSELLDTLESGGPISPKIAEDVRSWLKTT